METETITTQAINGKPDFLIIGAQKAGTTSLYKYLAAHHQIFMPAQKEIEFFSSNLYFAKGLDGYLNTWFKGGNTSCVWGEASPQYMMYDFVPARIYESVPNVRVIAILRNPIDRAVSHYMMAVRRGVEQKSLEEALSTLMRRGFVPDKERDSDRDYILFGEYGRIISGYLNFFKAEQIRIVFLEKLFEEPTAVLADIFDFLGVEANYLPANVGIRYHKGGIKKRFPEMERWLLRQEWLKKMVKRVIPAPILSRMLFWFETEFNVRRTATQADLSNSMRTMLRDYYLDDVRRLEQLIGGAVPWHEFWLDHRH